MKAIINRTIRQQEDVLYAELKTIKEQITAKINAEYHDQTSNIRAALDGLEYRRKKFVEEAKTVLREMPIGTRVKYATQNGQGATNIMYRTGTLVSKDLNIGLVNFAYDPDCTVHTVALNCCLQSIEKI